MNIYDLLYNIAFLIYNHVRSLFSVLLWKNYKMMCALSKNTEQPMHLSYNQSLLDALGAAK